MIIKKIVLLLLISLLIPMLSFSQNTYPKILPDSSIVITPTQLKQTNLIFLEHSKLKSEINLYQKIIENYKQKDTNFNKIDSLRCLEIDSINAIIVNTKDSLNKSTKTLNIKQKKLKRRNWIIVALATLSSGLLITQIK